MAKPLSILLVALLRAGGYALLLYALVLLGPEIEGHFFPVLRDAKIEYAVRQGTDVLVGGTLRKARSCEYIHPWRARAEMTGRTLQVLQDEVDKPNWGKADRIRFAPIIVVGAAGEPFRLYAEHRCHPFWTVFSQISVVDVP